MSNISVDQKLLKETLKLAIYELFQENREEFTELLSEIIEDIALIKAIEDGEKTELVERETILKLLNKEQ
ncbi:hypothetical protein [Crocosphaera sp. XPORK-15E]|uniref:hypothetical protein n=1 Tax=Crocosphaera sp. XPORK-15E TaxID=3110247 RepID=UPI002B21085F|nr:hypothetical protein [Crocosphaera sp. XPORK-15E]MEA5534929.1 hypothetical protein [Crocosphaera sp. XPORK-15E]